MERRESDIERDSATGREIEHRRVTTEGPLKQVESSVVRTFNPGQRAVELIYLAFGVLDGLLLIRLVLKLLGLRAFHPSSLSPEGEREPIPLIQPLDPARRRGRGCPAPGG